MVVPFERVPGARVVRRVPVKPRSQGAYYIPGVGIGPAMGTYTHDLNVVHMALARRVLYRYDKRTGIYHERYVPSAERVAASFGNISSCFLRSMPNPVECALEEFPKLYSGRRFKTYTNACISLHTEGPVTRKDARVTLFPKVESTQVGADPRGIQTRDPRYHASLGCFLKVNEKLFYLGVDRWFGEKTIVKGLNGAEVGRLIARKFCSFKSPVAVGLDASRFDRSVSIPLLQWVHKHYLAFLGQDPQLKALLDMQLVNYGRATVRDGKVDYVVHGGVMSGDIDTSLKGCLIMCAMVAAWGRHIGVDFKLINNGDDCVVFMEEADRARFTGGMHEWMEALGFDIVAEEPAYEIERIEFCQARPVIDSTGHYVMCRNPVKATVKDAMCRVGLCSNMAQRRWMRAVADCGLALAGDMPVFSAHYGAYARHAGEVKPRSSDHAAFAHGLMYMSKGMKQRFGVTVETRLSFWRAWGILPHEQVAIERYYESLSFGSGQGPTDSAPNQHYQTPFGLLCLSNGTSPQ